MTFHVDGFTNRSTGLGRGDKSNSTRVSPVEDLPPQELEWLFRSNGYAGTAIECLAAAAVRRGWEVNGKGVNQDLLKSHETRLKVQFKVYETLIWGRLYGAALMIPMFRRKKQPLPVSVWREPLNLRKVDELSHFMVVDCAYEATPYDYDDGWDSPQVGRPKTWLVQPSGATEAREVHHTRVGYMAGLRLPRRLFQLHGRDDSILQRCYESIRAMSINDQTLGNLIQELSTDVIQIDGLEALVTGKDKDKFYERLRAMNRMKSSNNALILSTKDKYENRAKPLSGIDAVMNQHKGSFLAAARMPATMALGDAPAGFNTDGASWRKIWSANVHDYQEFEVRDIVHLAYTAIFACPNGPTGGEIPEFTIKFRPTEEPTDEELATLRKFYAEMDAIYIERGVYTAGDVKASRFGPAGWSEEIDLPEHESAGAVDTSTISHQTRPNPVEVSA